ncbi:hypothetical protein Cgig2_031643 [Carnegiea gigantea]|uniref:Reverse transcriptase n=1 Tax=Carnegiea gigantea TaxID=171969 RepID=A0A9Q1GPB6_9CARY|nr:hypothetical protein Cgig2_031643 [Carnegiea gigantea]
MWHDSFAFTHVHFLTQGLSDHSPIALSFPCCPKLKSSFQFCDMRAKDEGFKDIIMSSIGHQLPNSWLGALKKKEVICREHYVKVTHSAISLLKQQGKANWIAYRDECSRFFMSRIKQRKEMTCIYTLRDHNDNWVEGFEEVAEVDHQVISQGKCLNIDQQIQLCQPFTNCDIKQELFSIINYKSPRPDGLTSGFYKEA